MIIFFLKNINVSHVEKRDTIDHIYVVRMKFFLWISIGLAGSGQKKPELAQLVAQWNRAKAWTEPHFEIPDLARAGPCGLSA